MSVNMSGYMNSGAPVRDVSAARAPSELPVRGGQELQGLKTGEQIRGTVVETDGSRVVIETKNHGTFSAELENGVQVGKGDVLDFEVRGMIGKQIALTPLYSNMNVHSSVLKALQAASLPATDANIRMVNEMMTQGMGIDRQSLHSMSGLVGQYGTADPALLVQMRQLGIPVTGESVMQMESYRNNSAQIMNGFGQIGEQLQGMMREMAESGQYGALGRLFTEAMKLFMEGELPVGGSAQTPGTEGSGQSTVSGGMTGAGQSAAVQEGAGQTGAAQDGAVSGAAAGSTTGMGGLSRFAADMLFLQGNAAHEAAGQIQGDGQTAGWHAAQGAGAGHAGNAQGGLSGPAEAPESAGGDIGRDTAEGARLQNAAHSQAAGEDAAARQENGGQAAGADESDRFSAFMKNFLESFGAKTAQGGEASAYRDAGMEIARMLRQPDFDDAFLNTMLKKWLLKPEQVSGKEHVQELYEKVLRQTAQLGQILESVGKQDSAAMKSLQSMEHSIEFLNELNQHFAYVQLPLKMSQQNAHGDLYVYTNKKGFAGRDGAVTAFLHLGMDHLGDMDIYVALQQNKVSTKFYLEDDTVIDFLEEHMDELNARLAGKGYFVKAELLQKDHEDGGNVFDQMLADSKNAGMAPMVMLSRQSFDARA